MVENSFAKVDVIYVQFFQNLKYKSLPFAQDEDGVSQPAASMKNNYASHAGGPKLAGFSWVGLVNGITSFPRGQLLE